MRKHPQVRVKGPYLVQCRLCRADIHLTLEHAYNPRNWLEHIQYCRNSYRSAVSKRENTNTTRPLKIRISIPTQMRAVSSSWRPSESPDSGSVRTPSPLPIHGPGTHIPSPTARTSQTVPNSPSDGIPTNVSYGVSGSKSATSTEYIQEPPFSNSVYLDTSEGSPGVDKGPKDSSVQQVKLPLPKNCDKAIALGPKEKGASKAEDTCTNNTFPDVNESFAFCTPQNQLRSLVGETPINQYQLNSKNVSHPSSLSTSLPSNPFSRSFFYQASDSSSDDELDRLELLYPDPNLDD